MGGILGKRQLEESYWQAPHLCSERTVFVSSMVFHSYLNLVSMFSNHLYQPRQEVRQGVRRQWLLESPKYLEGSTSIVP